MNIYLSVLLVFLSLTQTEAVNLDYDITIDWEFRQGGQIRFELAISKSLFEEYSYFVLFFQYADVENLLGGDRVDIKKVGAGEPDSTFEFDYPSADNHSKSSKGDKFVFEWERALDTGIPPDTVFEDDKEYDLSWGYSETIDSFETGDIKGRITIELSSDESISEGNTSFLGFI